MPSTWHDDAAPRPGHRWGDLLVIAEVARGNMGVVYRAQDEKLRREVALKVLVVGHDDREASERFRREAKSLARLSHPNIVRVHGFGVVNGMPFLTMDFVPGSTLQALIDRGGLPLSRAVDLLARIARAMDHAHSRGVLHRDLKPANILIGADGGPRITDFGLARLDDASGSLTNDGDVVGTPVYMAPEQIQGRLAELGPASDVWALGVMLYVLLTGRLPFRGRTVEEVTRQVLESTPPPPRQLLPALAESLEQIVTCALQKEPARRYQSAGELAQDLDAYLRGRPVLAGRVTPAMRARRLVRAGRRNLGAVLIVLVALVLLPLGGLVVRSVWRAASRGSQGALAAQALRGRGEAHARLALGLEAWRAGSAGAAREGAEAALARADAAAADLSRAAHGGQGGAGRTGGGPADEVADGLARDPLLAEVRARALGLRARARVGEVEGGAAAGAMERDLEASFRRVAGVEELTALVGLALRTGELGPARTARRLATAQGLLGGVAPLTEGGVTLAAALARLGAVAEGALPESGCPYCDPRPGGSGVGEASCGACGLSPRLLAAQDGAGRAARLGAARVALDRDDPVAALRHLQDERAAAGTQPLDAEVRLTLAEALRRAGHLDEQVTVLAPLLRGRSPAACLARAQGALDQGWPRAALAWCLRARPAPGEVDLALTEAWLRELARTCVGGETGSVPSLGLRAGAYGLQVETRRLVALTDQTTLAEPLAAPAVPTHVAARDADRLLVARLAPLLVEAIGRAGLVLAGVREPAELRELQADRSLLAPASRAAGVAAARRLGLPHRAIEALLRAAAGDPAELAPGPLREALAEATDWSEHRPAVAAAPLREGRALLGRVLAGNVEDAARGRQALTFAMRLDPFDPAPRMARAQLNLALAGSASNRSDTCEAALVDAAAAALLAPHDRDARALLLEAMFATGEARFAALLERLDAPGTALAADRRGALEAVAGRWRSPPDELLKALVFEREELLRRAGALQAGASDPRSLSDPLGKLRSSLDHLKQEHPEALAGRAAFLLQDPAQLVEWLAPGALFANTVRVQGLDPASLDPLVDGPAGDLARVARLTLQLARLEGAEARVREQVLADGRQELELLWRSRPGPALTVLQAALELSAGPAPAEILEDLVTTGGTTPFVERLRRVQGGEAASAQDLFAVRRAAEALARGPAR